MVNLFEVATLAPLFIPNPALFEFSLTLQLPLCATVVWGVLGWGTL